VATASQRPAEVNKTCDCGQVITGFWRSWTVTVKLQRFVLLLASVAAQFTCVTPAGKTLPDAGVHDTVAPLQLSVALAVYVTTASQRSGAVFATMFVGQMMFGG